MKLLTNDTGFAKVARSMFANLYSFLSKFDEQPPGMDYKGPRVLHNLADVFLVAALRAISLNATSFSTFQLFCSCFFVAA